MRGYVVPESDSDSDSDNECVPMRLSVWSR